MADGFNTKELDDFTKDFMSLANDKLPKESKKFLKTEGKKLTKQNKSTYNAKGIGEESGNLKSSFKTGKVYKYNGNLSIRGFNSSPHAHLLDKGWMHVAPDGSERWVPGFDFMEDAEKEFQDDYFNDAEDWIDKMLDEEGL